MIEKMTEIEKVLAELDELVRARFQSELETMRYQIEQEIASLTKGSLHGGGGGERGERKELEPAKPEE